MCRNTHHDHTRFTFASGVSIHPTRSAPRVWNAVPMIKALAIGVAVLVTVRFFL